MSVDNQALLDAIRAIVAETVRGAVAPIVDRLDNLEMRLGNLEARIESLEARIESLEARVETVEVRTSQMVSDLLYLRDRVPMLEERIDNGFRALKSDLGLAFSDIRRLNGSQERSEKAVETLKRELASLQQRIAALEAAHSE